MRKVNISRQERTSLKAENNIIDIIKHCIVNIPCYSLPTQANKRERPSMLHQRTSHSSAHKENL